MKMLKAAYLAAPAFFISFLGTLYYGLYVLRKPYYFSFESSDISPKFRSKLVAQTNRCPITSAEKLCATFKAKVPIIQSVSLRYKAGHKVHINCSLMPCYCILSLLNLPACLTQSGLVTNQDYYLPESLKNLPAVLINDQTIMIGQTCSPLITFLKRLPAPYLEDYHVTWNDKTCIFLQPKNQSAHLTFILANHTEFARCEPLIEKMIQLISQKPDGEKYSWLIDVRFKDYVIVTKKEKKL